MNLHFHNKHGSRKRKSFKINSILTAQTRTLVPSTNFPKKIEKTHLSHTKTSLSTQRIFRTLRRTRIKKGTLISSRRQEIGDPNCSGVSIKDANERDGSSFSKEANPVPPNPPWDRDRSQMSTTTSVESERKERGGRREQIHEGHSWYSDNTP